MQSDERICLVASSNWILLIHNSVTWFSRRKCSSFKHFNSNAILKKLESRNLKAWVFSNFWETVKVLLLLLWVFCLLLVFSKMLQNDSSNHPIFFWKSVYTFKIKNLILLKIFITLPQYIEIIYWYITYMKLRTEKSLYEKKKIWKWFLCYLDQLLNKIAYLKSVQK